jgi:FkbM family methyltransferase
MQTLDEWCARSSVSVDALKLDVQGTELDVFRGAPARADRDDRD